MGSRVLANSSTNPLTGGEEGGHLFLEYLGGAAGTLEKPRVHSLPISSASRRLGALGKVIILAREEVVAALLGLMVELQGFQPTFLGRAELVEDAILREKPEAVIIACVSLHVRSGVTCSPLAEANSPIKPKQRCVRRDRVDLGADIQYLA